MSAHTPGPWAVDDVRVYAATYDSKVVVKRDDGTEHEHGEGLVALVYTPVKAVMDAGCDYNAMHAANARLIAAAPDLLDAAKALQANRASRDNDEPCDVVACSRCHAEIGWPSHDFTTPVCEDCLLRDVIAKAEGKD